MPLLPCPAETSFGLARASSHRPHLARPHLAYTSPTSYLTAPDSTSPHAASPNRNPLCFASPHLAAPRRTTPHPSSPRCTSLHFISRTQYSSPRFGVHGSSASASALGYYVFRPWTLFSEHRSAGGNPTPPHSTSSHHLAPRQRGLSNSTPHLASPHLTSLPPHRGSPYRTPHHPSPPYVTPHLT